MRCWRRALAGRWCAALDDALGALADHGFTTRIAPPGSEVRAMSHEATNWAIKQRGLKPTTKIVLWHLCDRFNPDYGCFPSQARLAHDCEISRATLNRHLDELEARGLIRRIRVIDPKTGQQRPTRYLLGCEPGFTPRGPGQIEGDSTNPFEAGEAETPCPDLRHGSIAEKARSLQGLVVRNRPKAVSRFRTRARVSI